MDIHQMQSIEQACTRLVNQFSNLMMPEIMPHFVIYLLRMQVLPGLRIPRTLPVEERIFLLRFRADPMTESPVISSAI